MGFWRAAKAATNGTIEETCSKTRSDEKKYDLKVGKVGCEQPQECLRTNSLRVRLLLSNEGISKYVLLERMPGEAPTGL